MADNVLVTAGSGTTIATDEVTRAVLEHQQIVKLSLGADGAFDTLVDSGQQTMANSVPVVLASDQSGIVLGAGTAGIGKLTANSGVDIGDVDVASIVPGTGATNLGKAIDTATGGTDTGVLALATRDDALSALTPVESDNVQLRVDANGALWTRDDVLEAAIAGSELQVDVVAALPTGDNNIGNVDVVTMPSVVLAAGSANIGDVDVLTVPSPLSTAGGGTEAAALRVTLASDSTGLVSVDDNGGALTVDNAGTFAVQSQGYFVTVSTDVTRPADTTAYAVNDALSDSTTAPTAGGFTFTNAARVSGGSGIITDAVITTAADAATPIQGEIWLFNAAVTNINDNAAFAVTDAEIKTCVGKIPFFCEDAGNNGFYHVSNLCIGFTCSGSANLRFLVRVKNAYTPVSAEVFTFVLKIVQVT